MKSKSVLKIISGVGLLLTIVPSLYVFAGTIDIKANKILMLIGTIIWFLTAPLWMNKSKNA
jgi:hypothetical protein